jgi:hypothetical protein
MPIAEIINEIDAYLSRLRQARELLLDRITEAPQKRVHRRKRKIIIRQVAPVFSSRRRTEENKLRSNHPVAHLRKVRKQVDTNAQVPRAVAYDASHSEQPAIAEPERMIQQSVPITRLPARRRSGPIRPVRHRTATPALGTKPGAIKPAIALAGPIDTKIVVVPAEQVQRQREQAAHSAVLPARSPSSGLSGRRAFEALFRDETDPSKASGQ